MTFQLMAYSGIMPHGFILLSPLLVIVVIVIVQGDSSVSPPCAPVRPRRCNVIVPRILHLLFYEFSFRRSRCRPMCRRVGRAKEIHSPRHCRNRLSLTFATRRCRGPIGGSRHLQLVVIVIKFGDVSSSTPRQGRTRRPQPPPFC
jgi:hypothetical protein